MSVGRNADAEAAAEAARLAAEETPTEVVVNEEDRVRETLDRYVRAQNERDIQLYLSAFPVSGKQRDRIQQSWDSARSWELSMDVGSIRIDGEAATVRYQQTLTMQPNVGREQTHRGDFVMQLAKRDGVWIIQDNRAE